MLARTEIHSKDGIEGGQPCDDSLLLFQKVLMVRETQIHPNSRYFHPLERCAQLQGLLTPAIASLSHNVTLVSNAAGFLHAMI